MAPQTKHDLRLLAVVLLVTFAIASATSLLMPAPEVGGPKRQPSTFFNAPYGTKAAYHVIDRLGGTVARLRRPIDRDTLVGLDALILLRPMVSLEDHEKTVLREWVEAGHNFLYAPADEEEEDDDEEGGDGDNKSESARERRDRSRFFEWDELPDADANATAQLITTTFPPGEAGGESLLDGVGRLNAQDGFRLDPEVPVDWCGDESAAHVVWEDELGIVAAEIELGDGLMIVLADVYALSNKGLGDADHAIWLMNLVARLTRGDSEARLAFDEYHAGFPYRDRTWVAMMKLLWHERWAWSVTQVSVVALLALLAAGAHFGKPTGVVRGTRRTQGEFTRAAGRLLHAARAENLAWSTLFGHYRDRLCRAMRLPADASDDSLAAALDARGAVEAAEVVRAGGERRKRARPSDSELLEKTQRLHKAAEMIEHGVGATHASR